MSDLIIRKSEEETISMLQKNGFYINSVEQTPERCMIAVNQNGLALRWIPKAIQTRQMCLEAVRQAGTALRFVSKKLITKELYMEAVKSDGNALQYIPEKELTKELCFEAVNQNGRALRLVPKEIRTAELYELAINQNGNALQYIPRQELSKEFINIAIEKNPLSLEFVPGNRKSKALCMQAVTSNPLALQYVPERFKTNEVCEAAIENDWRSFLYIPDEMYSVQRCIDMFTRIVGIANEVGGLSYRDSSFIKEIVERLPATVNSNPRIIDLERELGARKITCKLYDKFTRKFMVREYLCYEEDEKNVEFNLFQEFYDYLSGDLKEANLLDFDFSGLRMADFNIEGAYISSDVLISQGIYDSSFYDKNIKECCCDVSLSAENEIVEACTILHESEFENTASRYSRKIYYISDIHINHKLISRFPKHATKQEVVLYIRSYVEHMVSSATDKSYKDYLLIAGDISYNYDISVIFYTELVKVWDPTQIIVIAGNHELWDNNKSDTFTSYQERLNRIIAKYRELFSTLRIWFLQNDLLLLDNGNPIIFSEQELVSIHPEYLREVCLRRPIVVLGGLGYSGYCAKYNATCGLYRSTIKSLEEDLEQTKQFESIYKRVNDAIGNNPVIVLTHTPKDNWSKDQYNSQWIYVNGHTHHNDYCSTSTHRIYADNQIGYHSKNAGLKYFNLSSNYDIFRYYEDGIFKITREQYIEFNRGIGNHITYNRVDGITHMLKNQGIYCFIYENEKNGKLYMLNGGAIKTLEHNDLNYYFERMLCYADAIKGMFEGYNHALKTISNSIKSIGGSGTIHGCIVDIDYYNHIYLNPLDGKVTPYYALSIIQKYVYRDIKALLKEQRTDLYLNYQMLLKDKTEGALQLRKNMDAKSLEVSQLVPETFMYGPSRIVRALQYLFDVKVIRFWNDRLVESYAFKSESKKIDSIT